MLFLKGFVTISQYINNEPGVTSPLGELSTWSLTYTKERGEYSSSLIQGYKLHTFRSVDDSNQLITVSQPQVEQIVQLVKTCIDYASTHIRPYNPIDFKNNLLGAFFNRVSNIELGQFIDNGNVALPEYISWTSDEIDGNSIKIWLADQSFQDQYDEYEIDVIAPITNLDDFFGFYNEAVTEVQGRTLSDLTLDIQAKKDIHPETYLKLLEFDYINSNNTTQRTKTNWAILIYGKAGDQIDKIKDALVDYILHNSTYARQDWTVIFPDIFKRTEFIILPRWDLLSIPNLVIASALYSSMVNPIECVTFAINNINFYPQAWVQDNITIMPFDYKALSLLVIDGNDNTVGNQDIKDLFHDYIPVSSTNLDFSRMTVKTREWVLLLEQLLITAETATEFNTIPGQLRRVTRNGILFISVLYENVNYMVAAKNNLMYTPVV